MIVYIAIIKYSIKLSIIYKKQQNQARRLFITIFIIYE
jgi:hypothetical protein